MLNQIVAALKLSLKECDKYEDPCEYVYQLGEVLLRYKTNLFSLMSNRAEYVQDPKEFFHIKIVADWRVRPGYNRSQVLIDSSPTLLYINGFRPAVGERMNKEQSFNTTVRVDDIINLNKIASIKTDYYQTPTLGPDNKVMMEEDIMAAKIGHAVGNSSILFQREWWVDEVMHFTTQINSQVHPSALAEHQLVMSSVWANDSNRSLDQLERAKLKEQGLPEKPKLTPSGKKGYTAKPRTPSGEKEVQNAPQPLRLRTKSYDRVSSKSFF